MPSEDDSRARDPSERPRRGEVVAGAGGVLFDPHGRVLVLRHANGDLIFPKGHLEPGETPLQAALREVEEEAGVLATCPDPSRTWTTAYVNAQGVPREITWFALRTEADVPNLTEELFLAGEFLPPLEALDRLTHATDRELLSRVIGAGFPEGWQP